MFFLKFSLFFHRADKRNLLMQYVSLINRNFKKNYQKYQVYLQKKEEMQKAKEILALNSIVLSQANKERDLKQIPQINASSVFKPKLNKQKTKNLQSIKALKKKKTKNFNALLVENPKESFLITQSEILKEILSKMIIDNKNYEPAVK